MVGDIAVPFDFSFRYCMNRFGFSSKVNKKLEKEKKRRKEKAGHEVLKSINNRTKYFYQTLHVSDYKIY